jgi:hypothetical protein
MTSRVFKVDNGNDGVLPPTKTNTEMNATTTPPTGLTLYNTTTGFPTYYNSIGWVKQGAIFNPSYACGFSRIKSVGTGSIQNFTSGSYTLWYFLSPANGDQYDLTFTSLPANNYKTMLVIRAVDDVGIFNISFSTNGGAYSTLYTGLDFYSLTPTNYQVPIFVNHTGGNLVIRVLITGKNASSSNYYFVCGFYQATPQVATAITTAQKFAITANTALPTGNTEAYNSFLFPIWQVRQ